MTGRPFSVEAALWDDINTAVNAVIAELYQATDKFGPFASAHEGYAVILEELDELWHEVKHGSIDRQREEAVQVAAMALRFIIDVAPSPMAEAAPSVAAGHQEHYRTCNCLADSGVCCVPTCACHDDQTRTEATDE